MYVAYAIPGTPAPLTRATHEPDDAITLRPVGGPHTRLDLATDTGRRQGKRDRQGDSRYTLYGPTCDQRCRLELTFVPTLSAAGAR